MSQTDGAPVAATDEEQLLESIGTAFSRLRRRTSSIPVEHPIARTDVRRDLLLAVVEEADGLLSVNGAAAALAMERTAVSRLVAACVESGLVERVASQTDGRSITLRLTTEGRETLQRSRHQQRQAFDYITRDWSRADRVQFARLLHRYVAATDSLPAPDEVD
jgi:DNA-binding MarR family transcriptional regulator